MPAAAIEDPMDSSVRAGHVLQSRSVKSVEEQFVGAARLTAKLRAEREENDIALAVPDAYDRFFTTDVALLPKSPAAHQDVFLRIGSDGLDRRRRSDGRFLLAAFAHPRQRDGLERATADERCGRLLFHPPRERMVGVDLGPNERARNEKS